jgi:hypothetical protein
MNQKNVEQLIVGTALALSASVLLPIIKTSLRPLSQNSMVSVNGLISRARSIVQYTKEEIEDIVAEAQFERVKKQFDQEIAQLSTEEAEEIKLGH